MLERDIERKVKDYAKKKGMLVYKFVSPNNRSVPDDIIFYKGITFLIEFKAPGKHPTKLQQTTIDRLKSEQIAVYVIDDVEQGKQLVDSYVK